MSRRAAVVVVDACGVGALPDAADYGDAGANTLGHLADAVGGLDLPVLQELGLGSIAALRGVAPAAAPVLHGRLAAQGPGKDSTAGHWELMGVVAAEPAPTYPDGFGADVLARIGRPVLGNAPANGIAAIARFGAEHLRTGALILYTSQDSVLQLAAHVDRVAPDELYAICAHLREHVAVGRVIARPFAGQPGAFARTDGRRDFALAPPTPSHLDALRAAGVTVHGVGKVAELFAGRGFDASHPGADNAQALAAMDGLLDELDDGLVFCNLVDTDQVFGHRKDAEGFHGALRVVDAALGRWVARMRDGDLLVVTADHGCDPAAAHTDHTREYAPLLALRAGDQRPGARHDGVLADVGATVLHHLTGRRAPELPGHPLPLAAP